MKLPQESAVLGKWLDKSELKNGDQVKIVSEAKLEAGQHGEQLVAKVKLRGGDNEAKNVAINGQSRKAIVQAYGDETSNWIDKIFTVELDKTTIGGKRVLVLYLIPEEFELKEDAGGYLVIQHKPYVDTSGPTIEYPEEEINPESIPF